MKTLETAAMLARELAKQEPLPRLPLYQIASELLELLEAREEMDGDGALPDETKAIEQRIDQYMLAGVKKVDEIAQSFRACEVDAAECRKEAERLLAYAKRYENRAERIKAAALRAMQALGVTSLKTPTNELRIQANGGRVPVEVLNEAAVPSMFKSVTVTMPADEWERIVEQYKFTISGLVTIAYSTLKEKLYLALQREPVAGARLGERGEHLRIK